MRRFLGLGKLRAGTVPGISVVICWNVGMKALGPDGPQI